MRNIATVLAAVLVAFMFTGCASAPERRETALMAATAEAEQPANSCRQSGRTTIVRGDCPVAWDGQTVRVRGTVDVTPGTSQGRPCLRLQTKDASPVTVSSYGEFRCGGLDPALMEEVIVALQQEAPIDPARLKELLDYWKGPIDATLLNSGDLRVGGKASCRFGHWRGGSASIGPSVVCH